MTALLLLALFLFVLLICLIIERNIETRRCGKYISEIYDHDPGTD